MPEPSNHSRFDSSFIKRASLNEAARIAEISTLVNIHNLNRLNRGFLCYSLSEEEYAQKINEEEVDLLIHEDEIIGFACCVQRPPTAALVQTDSSQFLSIENKVFNHAQQLGQKDFVLIEQIAIDPAYHNSGFGDFFCGELSKFYNKVVFLVLMERPLRNPRIAYWHERGFNKVGEFNELPTARFLAHESLISPSESLTWGIYQLGVGCFRSKQLAPTLYESRSDALLNHFEDAMNEQLSNLSELIEDPHS